MFTFRLYAAAVVCLSGPITYAADRALPALYCRGELGTLVQKHDQHLEAAVAANPGATQLIVKRDDAEKWVVWNQQKNEAWLDRCEGLPDRYPGYCTGGSDDSWRGSFLLDPDNTFVLFWMSANHTTDEPQYVVSVGRCSASALGAQP